MFPTGRFPAAIQSGLGMYCLPDIRNLYLYHNYPTTSSEFVWARAHRILRRMRLETLTLRFGSKVDPSDFSVEKGWFRDLLIFRDWHLRSLDIFFRIGSLAGGPLPMTQTLRDLMIGPEADEKYKAFVLTKAGKCYAHSMPLVPSRHRCARNLKLMLHFIIIICTKHLNRACTRPDINRS